MNPPAAEVSALNAVVGGRSRRSLACIFCRLKKVRCDGGRPCTYCTDRGVTCTWPKARRTRTKDRPKDQDLLFQRLAHVEALLLANKTTSNNGHVVAPSDTDIAAVRETSVEDERPIDPCTKSLPDIPAVAPPDSAPTVNGTKRANQFPNQPDSHEVTAPNNDLRATSTAPIYMLGVPGSPQSSLPWTQSEKSGPLSERNEKADDLDDASSERQERSSVYSAESTFYEYHGPRSFMSICSKPGIQWVTDRCGCLDFQDSAASFTREVMRPLKMEKRFSPVRAAEPNAKEAWLYTKVFFEEAPGSQFGVVQRPWFESRLRAHLETPNRNDEPAWYALRNVIYATGSRLHLAKTTTFRDACQISWGWFENAFSVHTEILYLRTSILGLQALSLMAYFADELGSPALEYMLCSNALRLACSKGLHRQAISSWNLSPQEASQRDWIFWALYSLEKNIASRSGRPSITDDDDISCQIPTSRPLGGSGDVVFCNMWVRFSQLSSLVGKQLSSVKAFRCTTSATIDTVVDLDRQLRSLKNSMAEIFRVDAPIHPSTLPANISLTQALGLKFTYHTLLFDIHTTLTHPWSKAMLQCKNNEEQRKQIESSCSVVAEAARALILASNWIHLDANCTILIAFTAMIQAVINLFIHVLQHPEYPSVRSDLSLLDIAAGHFARLEFVTNSEISILFVKDVARLARTFVECTNNAPITADTSAKSDSFSSDIDTMRFRDCSQANGMNERVFDFEFSDLEPENLSMLLPGGDPDAEITDFLNWEQ